MEGFCVMTSQEGVGVMKDPATWYSSRADNAWGEMSHDIGLGLGWRWDLTSSSW